MESISESVGSSVGELSPTALFSPCETTSRELYPSVGVLSTRKIVTYFSES